MAVKTTTPPLTTARLTMFAGMLDEQRQFRVEQIAQLTATQIPNDRAETAAHRHVCDAILRGAVFALAEIDSARTRMTAGTYGRCVTCTVRLPLERLEVLPQAARCWTCQRANS